MDLRAPCELDFSSRYLDRFLLQVPSAHQVQA